MVKRVIYSLKELRLIPLTHKDIQVPGVMINPNYLSSPAFHGLPCHRFCMLSCLDPTPPSGCVDKNRL